MIAVELLQNEVTEKLPSEAENLQTAISRLQSALNKTFQYVDNVVVSQQQDEAESANAKCRVCCLCCSLMQSELIA